MARFGRIEMGYPVGPLLAALADRILHNLDLIEIGVSESEGVSLEEFPVHRHGAVVAKLIKWVFFLCRETNLVAHRFLQEQTRQRKQRIRDRAGLDLRDYILKCR